MSSEVRTVPQGYKRIVFPVLIGVFCLVLLALAYCITVAVRGAAAYDDIRKGGLGYNGKLYEFDPAMGYVPVPNADGAFTIPKGAPVATHHDDEGLRAPLRVGHSFQGGRHPRLLFLGDSFTYGQLVAAEDAFAFKAAQKLGGESINGGVPGYGLAQMVLRARKLIPKYKPDYVIVQYSPWLAGRARSEFAQDSRKTSPVPYYADAGNGGVRIVAPAFSPSPALFVFDKYRLSPSTLGDRMSFLWGYAFPLIVQNDASLATLRVRQWLGIIPKPAQSEEKIIRQAYAEIDAIAEKNGARTILLALGRDTPMEVPEWLFPPRIAGVHGWRIMVQKLNPATSDNYIRHYVLWRGNPPEPVDGHPNEYAHEIIAEAVAARIRQLSKTPPE